jgi:DNA excision repair protein ERCC-2
MAGMAYARALDGGHAVLEAGTGTGKTVAVLSAVLSASRQNGRRIVWLTRTNAQAHQVLTELRKLQEVHETREAVGAPVLAVFLQGRLHQCPQLAEDPRFKGADSEEYARLCSRLKRSTKRTRAHPGWGSPGQDPEHEAEKGDEGPHQSASGRTPKGLPMAPGKGCPYYQTLLESDPDRLRARLLESPQGAEEFSRSLIDEGICPYEAAKAVLEDARLVVAPYVYLFDPRLSKALMQWMGASLDDCIVVVDEAHNLPDHLRDLFSGELSVESLDRALDEARKSGDPEVHPGVPASRLVRLVKATLEELAAQRLSTDEEDAMVEREGLLVPLWSHLGVASPSFDAILSALALEGQRVREQALRAGRLPRSYLGSLARFLCAWVEASPGEFVPLVQREPSLRLVLYCLDPAIGARTLQEVHASIHFSGTLEPLEAHRGLLGLPIDARCASFASPYERKNLRLLLVDDVTTQYERRRQDPAMMDRLAAHVAGFSNTHGLNKMLLFPSHSMLQAAKESGDLPTGDQVFLEEPGISNRRLKQMLRTFSQTGRSLQQEGVERKGEGGIGQAEGVQGALWAGVTGGRVSEGMDFPGAELEALCLVGVPYPRPTARHAALFAFNDVRFGKGWEYTVEAPTWRRVKQAIGRVVRDAEDKGIVFLLDARFRRWSHRLGRLERLGDEEDIPGVLRAWVAQRSPQV